MSAWWLALMPVFYCLIIKAVNRAERLAMRRMSQIDPQTRRDLEALIKATREHTIVTVVTDADWSGVESGHWPPLHHKEHS